MGDVRLADEVGGLVGVVAQVAARAGFGGAHGAADSSDWWTSRAQADYLLNSIEAVSQLIYGSGSRQYASLAGIAMAPLSISWSRPR